MAERSRLRETGRDDCTTDDFPSFPEGDLHTHTSVCGHSDVLCSRWSMTIILQRRRFFPHTIELFFSCTTLPSLKVMLANKNFEK